MVGVGRSVRSYVCVGLLSTREGNPSKGGCICTPLTPPGSATAFLPTRGVSHTFAVSINWLNVHAGIMYIYFHAFSERWFDFSLFSCRFVVSGESLEEQLVNLRAPEIAIYAHIYAHVLSSPRREALIRAFRAGPP